MTKQMTAELPAQPAPNLDVLNALLGSVVSEMGAASNAALVILGGDLGLFETLARIGPATPGELAKATQTHERYVREWLSAQAASGFIAYNAATGKFEMTPEQAMVFVEDGPANVTGGFQALAAAYAGVDRLKKAFKSGAGVGWGEHCNCLFCGTDRLFRAGYNAHLIADWLPALTGVVDKLQRGGKVADIGCGHGSSSRIIAQAFPKATVHAFDVHEPSIECARRDAAGISNLRFDVADARSWPGEDFDLVCMFDALHDMGDPVGAARHARTKLATDGAIMLVEPRAGDSLSDNLNPVGRLFYAASTHYCVPGSMSQDVGLALGAQAGEKQLTEVLKEAGFTRIRRASETPFNIILEARA
jgi:2-polyprenyl-3-methyl-5-hydroxy-6-metoxy-1,4-benzoquinol methylase